MIYSAFSMYNLAHGIHISRVTVVQNLLLQLGTTWEAARTPKLSRAPNTAETAGPLRPLHSYSLFSHEHSLINALDINRHRLAYFPKDSQPVASRYCHVWSGKANRKAGLESWIPYFPFGVRTHWWMAPGSQTLARGSSGTGRLFTGLVYCWKEIHLLVSNTLAMCQTFEKHGGNS